MKAKHAELRRRRAQRDAQRRADSAKEWASTRPRHNMLNGPLPLPRSQASAPVRGGRGVARQRPFVHNAPNVHTDPDAGCGVWRACPH
eukprot:6585543-Prymnesium_polylepis.1